MSETNESLRIKLALSGMAALQADFKRGIELVAGFGDAAKRVSGVLAAVVGLGAIGEAFKGVLEAGKNLKLLQAQAGASIPTLIALEKLLVKNGESADAAGALFAHMQRAIVDAAENGGEALRVLQDDLHLNMASLAAMDAGEQFKTIGAAIARMENPARRTAAAMAVFSRSGYELVSMFRNVAQFKEAFGNPGAFAEAMSRSAGMFANMNASLEEMGQSGKRFLTGVLDQIGPMFQEAFNALGEIDLTPLGQKIGAFFAVVIQSVRDDKFPEMIGLLVEAGFQLGKMAAERIFTEIGAFIESHAFASAFVSLTNAVMAFGVQTSKFLINALTQPVIYMSAAFDWLGQNVKHVIGVAMNFWIDQINRLNSKLHLIRGGVERVQETGSESFGAALGTMQGGVPAILGDVNKYLDANLQKSREILKIAGGITAADNTDADALKRVQALIDAQLSKRAAIGAGEGGKAEHTGDGVVTSTRYNELLKDELAQKERLVAIEDALGAVETDYTLTAAQKWDIRRKLLEEEKAALDKIIADMRQRAALEEKSNPQKAEEIRGGVTGFEKQSGGVSKQMGQLGANPNSFGDQMRAQMTKMRDEWGTVMKQMAETLTKSIGTAIESVSTNLTAVIMKTKTWAQAFRDVGTTIVSSIIQSIIQMGIKWVVNMTMMAISWAANQAAIVIASAGAAAALAAVWAAPAALSLVATDGASGSAALGVMATMTFAEGGYTGAGGKYDAAGIVHRGEFVMPADAVGRIGLPRLEAMRQGANSGGSTVVSGGGDTHLHVWADEADAVRHVKSNPQMQHAIMGLVSRNTHKFIPRRV